MDIKLSKTQKSIVTRIYDYLEKKHSSRDWVHHTNHGNEHSENILGILGKILGKNVGVLNRPEMFVLVASAYLHDIGLSNGATVEPVDPNGPGYSARRKEHPEIGSNFILTSEDIKGIIEDDNAQQYIARITYAHGGEPGLVFSIDSEENEGLDKQIDQRQIRVALLAGLLRLADELDIGYHRVKFDEVDPLKLELSGLFELYRNHYVASVNIENGIICILFDFHEDMKNKSRITDMFVERTVSKVEETLAMVDEYHLLWNSGIKLKMGKERIRFPKGKKALPAKLEYYLESEYRKLFKQDADFCFNNLSAPFLLLQGLYDPTNEHFQWQKDDIVTTFSETMFKLSGRLLEDYDEVIASKRAIAADSGAPFHNAEMYRVANYRILIKEDDKTEKVRLQLDFQRTRYFDFTASNERLREGEELANEFLYDPRDFATSHLSNPLAVLLSVYSIKDEKIVIVKRPSQLAEYANTFHVAVAGSMCHNSEAEPKKKDYIMRDGKAFPCPFKAAIREAREEIGLCEEGISKVFFWGIERDLTNGKPELLGTIESCLSIKDIIDGLTRAETRFEIQTLVVCDFKDPMEVCKYLCEPNQWVPGGYVNTMMTLLGKFGISAVKEALAKYR